MKNLLLLLSLCALPMGILVAEDQPVTPVEVDDRFYKKKSSDAATGTQSAKCKQLRHRIAELKGKPQRRHAAVERYKLECQSGTSSSDQRPGIGGPLY